ncbi:hypothetical protein QQ045_026630 [Rhodiola kirilowii]
MSQSNNMKKSPGTESTGTPALRRSAREMSGKNSGTPVKSDVSQSPPVVRKSERLKRNSPETSATQRKTQKIEGQSSASPLRRSERGNNHSSSKLNEKSEKSSSTPKAKGKNRSEARNYEKVAAKRRRLDAKCFKALFLQEKNMSPEPSEKPKQLGKLAQSNCNATETEAEDEHHSVNNQHGNKLRKKIDKCIEHSDVFDGINTEIQIKEVCNVEEKEPNESNVDHHVPASRCEANTAELDSSRTFQLSHDSDPAIDSEPACVSCSSNEANMDNTTLESGRCQEYAEQFLEYVMENHHVTREPVALLHAFQLSVVTSLRKQMINGRESLALAKKHLNFCCNEEDTDYVYLKMGLLKELFIQSAVNDKANGQASNTLLPDRYTTEDSLFGLNQVTAGIRSSRVFDAEKLLVKSVRQIKKKCRERMATLIKNQQEMIEELQKSSDEEKAQMEQLYKVEVAVVRSIHAHNPSMAVDKLKALEDQYSKRLEEHRNNLIIGLKSLEDKHSSERNKESELASSWTEDIVKEHIELLRKLTRNDSEESKRICITDEQLVVLDGQKECCTLENQEVPQNQPGVLAGRVGACQSVILDDPSDLPSAASEAVNKPVVMNSVVSTSDKVLLEHSTRVDAESGQVPCGQAACSLDLTHDTEVAESSSVDVLPLHLSTSASTDGPSAGKTLDFYTASQQLSPSADFIPGSGLLNPLIIDVPQSLSSDSAVGIRHDAEPQSTDPIVPLPPSPAAPGKEIDNSSPVSLLQADNGLPPTHLNVDMAATENQPGLTSSAMTSRSEQSHSGIQPDQSLLHTAVDHCNVEPSAAEAVQQLSLVDSSSSQLSGLPSTQLNVEMPATEKQPGLPSSAITPISEQSDSDIQRDQSLLHTAVDHLNIEPSAAEAVHQLPLVDSSSSQLSGLLPTQLNVEMPATEKQPGLPSSAFTPISEQSDSDIQRDQSLLHTAVDGRNIEPLAAEAVRQLPFVDSSSSQLNSSVPLLEEHPSGGNDFTPNADAPKPSSAMTSRSEESHSGIQPDQSLLHTAVDHCNVEPSGAEAVQQLPLVDSSSSLLSGLPSTQLNVEMPATEKQPGLPSSAFTPISEQSDSDIQRDQSLLHPAVDHCNVQPSAVEAVHQLRLVDSSSSQLSGLPPTQLNVEMPATEKQPGLPSSAFTPISEQSDSDIQRDQSLLHTAVDHRNIEPSAAEAVQPLPLVDSSCSQLNSSLPLLEEQPSGGNDFTPIADAPNPSPLPSVTRSQSTSIPGPRATNAMSGIATSRSGTTVSSTVSSRMPMFSYMDPLQSELERVQREADHSVKIYEEMKQQLHSEFDKEMAEIVAQIRKKYETTNVELDAAFKCKKDELDAYHSKVSMNRMLAEVFRNKCMEAKISVTPVMARENVQYQLPRLRPESAPRLPIFPATSSAVQTSRNLQEAHTPGRPTVPSASSAAPTARILQSAQNPICRTGPSAAASQNSLRPGGPSAAASQNSLHPGGSSASASQNLLRPDGSYASGSQNSLRPGGPFAVASQNSFRPGSPSDGASQNSIHPGSLSAAASWNSSRPVTPLASAPLPAIQTSGTLHASHNPMRSGGTSPMTSLPRSTTSGSPAMQATMSRPVQVINRSSALFSNSSARPVNTASTTPSSVNLDSLSGSSSTPPHLRSRVSHPMAPNTTFSACAPSISSRPQYTNVSLPAPSTVNQQSSYHRLPAPQSANAPIGTQGLTMGTITAFRMLSDIEKRVRNGTVVNLPHSQTTMPSNGPSQIIRPPNSGSNHNLPIASVSATAQVVCLSDDE